MRNILLDHFIFNAPKMGGIGRTVEIDESKFGKRKYHRGRKVEGTWVFGGVERETGRVFMVPVKCRSSAYLVPILEHFVESGTTIISDCWKAYNCLENKGFVHLTVNHSLNFVDPETGAHSNTIEGLWRHAKEAVGNKSRRRHLMDGHIAKYLFFKFCRRSNLSPFEELCRCIVNYYAQPDDELSPRAKEWFDLKERLDKMVIDANEVMPTTEDDETEYESEPDDAELDNPNDPEWDPEYDS